jgi:hypothetical protein
MYDWTVVIKIFFFDLTHRKYESFKSTTICAWYGHLFRILSTFSILQITEVGSHILWCPTSFPPPPD